MTLSSLLAWISFQTLLETIHGGGSILMPSKVSDAEDDTMLVFDYTIDLAYDDEGDPPGWLTKYV